MIDFDGYRPNVGIIISNRQGQVLWAKRCGQNSWQFPQGGINNGETPEQAMYRELYEEVGLSRQDVKILAVSKGWLRYKLPKRLVRNDGNPVCIGQKQRWFLLALVSGEDSINMQATKTPEFDGWRWVSYWYPVRQVISFKREVYRKVMKEFSSVIMAAPDRASAVKSHQHTSQYKSLASTNTNNTKDTATLPSDNERSTNVGKKESRYQRKQRKFNQERSARQKGEQRK
nr:RNA pyrophosphohydrolase [Testudinibacter sp. TR-2022]